MKKLVIEFDDEEIDELMAVEAIKGFELPWVKDIKVEEFEKEIVTCCVCGKVCAPQEDCKEVYVCPDKNCSVHKEK